MAAVVLFHAKLGFAAGGFVGVDVFFVISGYLISSIIAKELGEGDFSFRNFYLRRVRRILPALYFVLVLAFVASLFVLFPRDQMSFSRSLLATLFFGSNIFFFSESGYFAAAADRQPLLHTWSLGVEEQFYFLWPLLLALGFRYFRKRMNAVLGLITLASLLASGVLVWTHPTTTFYLLPTRLWEMSLGGLLSLGFFPQPKSKLFAHAEGAIGLALVLGSASMYSYSTTFPGFSALPPCVGAALLIRAGKCDAFVRRILSMRPIVGLGLLSYSLYLWHWPIFVFYGQLFPGAHSAGISILLIAASTAMAAFSLLVIENPIRRRKRLARPRPLVAATLGTSALLVAMALAALHWQGFPSRFTKNQLKLANASSEFGLEDASCFGRSAAQIRAQKLCILGAENGSEDFVLWGDSHAEAIAPAIQALAAERGIRGVYSARKNCLPLVGVETVRQDYGCLAFNQAMLELAQKSPAQDIIIVSRWNLYAEGPPAFGSDHSLHTNSQILDDVESSESAEARHRIFSRGLARTANLLSKSGKQVWLVGQAPYVGYDVPALLARHRDHQFTNREFGPSLKTHNMRSAFLQTEAEHLPVQLVDLSSSLCFPATGTCDIYYDGQALYSDDDHLSRAGAGRTQSALREMIRKIAVQ